MIIHHHGDFSPTPPSCRQNRKKNQHLNILSYASTLIVKITTRSNMLKRKLNERYKIRFDDISVNFPRPFQGIKMYKGFIL